VLDPDVHVASDGLECWLGEPGVSGNQENWEGRSVWVCRVEMQKKHGLGAFSVFFPTTSFFKESHTFQMSDKATDKWKKPTNAMLHWCTLLGDFTNLRHFYLHGHLYC